MKATKKYVLWNFVLSVLIMTGFVIAGIDYFIICSKKISLIIFSIEYVLMAYTGMRMGLRYKRKSWFHIWLNVLGPLGMYLFAWLTVEVTKRLLIQMIISFAALMAMEYFWTEEKSYEKRVRDFRKYVCTEFRTMFCITLIIMGVMSIWLQVKIHNTEQQSEAIYQDWDEYRVEDSLEYNMEEAATIENWKNLSRRKKINLLMLYRKIETRYWGMADEPKLKVAELAENVGGQYSWEEDTVYIAEETFMQEDGYQVLHTLFHEMAHRQQHLQVEMYYKMLEDKGFKEYYESSLWLDTITYAREFDNYISGDVNTTLYQEQLVEKHANYYAAVGVEECKERIGAYLGKKN